MSKVVIAHLYPNELNIYGDRGNIITLTKRLEWRGYGVRLDKINRGTKYDFTKADIVFGGGGQDRGQALVADDLLARKENISQAVKDGVVMLGICGTYQLFGSEFTTQANKVIPGLGIFDAKTIASNQRMIGNVIVQSQWGELVGFENHSGQTTLGDTQEPLGEVRQGFGNNSSKQYEGAVVGNTFGTYLHGPLLPKNPVFSDELIARALHRKYKTQSIKPLNDTLEHQAAATAKSRPR